MQSALLRAIGTPDPSAQHVAPLSRARLLVGPRSLHFGMQVVGPGDRNLLVLQLHDVGGFQSVTARNLDNDEIECDVPVASLRPM